MTQFCPRHRPTIGFHACPCSREPSLGLDSLGDRVTGLQPCLPLCGRKVLPVRVAFFSSSSFKCVCVCVCAPTDPHKQVSRFFSHHPIAHKTAIVQTLHSQAQALTSSPVTRSQEEQTIFQALIQNGYPTSFIQRHSYSSQKATFTLSSTNHHCPHPTSEAPQRLSDGSFPH